MRLREVKKKIEEFGSDGKITVSLEQSLGNFFIVSNSRKLFSLLQLLSEQKWNKTDFEQIQAIIDSSHALNNDEVMLDSTQYSYLNTYVNKVNEQLPIFFGIVDSLSDEQGEFDINIKLSDGIKTVNDLNELTSEIKDLEKFATLDGKKLEFSGFDVGSYWITFSAGCAVVYGFIMACTKLAQEVLKTQEQYYKTKEAKIHYQMTLKKGDKGTQAGLKDYCKEYCEKYLEQDAIEIAQGIGEYNGTSENEIGEKAKNAAKSLLKIIGSGNEIHVSLSSNQIIEETENGSIQMNYEELKAFANEEKTTKQLNTASASEDTRVPIIKNDKK